MDLRGIRKKKKKPEISEAPEGQEEEVFQQTSHETLTQRREDKYPKSGSLPFLVEVCTPRASLFKRRFRDWIWRPLSTVVPRSGLALATSGGCSYLVEDASTNTPKRGSPIWGFVNKIQMAHRQHRSSQKSSPLEFPNGTSSQSISKAYYNYLCENDATLHGTLSVICVTWVIQRIQG